MSILDRVNRILKANIQWIFDKIEPPEKEVESTINELAEAITEGKAAAATYGAICRRMELQRDELSDQSVKLQQVAEHAIKTENDEAARRALAEKIKIEERVSSLLPALEKSRQSYEQLRDNLGKLQDRLKQAQTRLAELKARKLTAEAHKAFDEQLDGLGGTNRLDDMEDQVLEVETEVQVSEEIRGSILGDADLIAKSRDLQVEAEMQAIRRKIEDSQDK